jgi:hypothetical protein
MGSFFLGRLCFPSLAIVFMSGSNGEQKLSAVLELNQSDRVPKARAWAARLTAEI